MCESPQVLKGDKLLSLPIFSNLLSHKDIVFMVQKLWCMCLMEVLAGTLLQ